MAARMRYWDAVFAFLVAMAIAALLTPLAARFARRIGAIDFPRARGLSQQATPRLGGLAILIGALVAALLWLPATIHLTHVPHTPKDAQGNRLQAKARQMASVAHIMGDRIVGAEAFTSGDSEQWKMHPATVKALAADLA